MKYCLIEVKKNNIKYYTEELLKYLIRINGHNLTDINDCDFILISLCNIAEINILKNIREKYKNKKIIVGGQLGFIFKLCGIFADYVNVGQGFEFFKCKTEQEIINLDSIYFNGCNKIIKPSIVIEWANVPLIQTAKNQFYYLGSIGCKNKCSFCAVSWQNKQETNPLLSNIIHSNKKRNIRIIGNESVEMVGRKEKVKDYLLRDYLCIKNTNCRFVRCGIEFVLEDNRRKNGKCFTNNEFVDAVKKSKDEKNWMQFFIITGLETKQDIKDFFEIIPDDYDTSPPMHFKFTQLIYNLFTPIFKKRHEINIDNYIEQQDLDEIYKNISYRKKRVRFYPVKYGAYSLWSTAIQLTKNINEFNLFWQERNNKNKKEIYNLIKKNGILNNDYSNEIKFWYQNEIR